MDCCHIPVFWTLDYQLCAKHIFAALKDM